jgi:hypothetical protein
MRPKLRSLEIRPVGSEEGGEEFWLLRDREGLSEPRYVPIEFGPLLSLLDGTRASMTSCATTIAATTKSFRPS